MGPAALRTRGCDASERLETPASLPRGWGCRRGLRQCRRVRDVPAEPCSHPAWEAEEMAVWLTLNAASPAPPAPLMPACPTVCPSECLVPSLCWRPQHCSLLTSALLSVTQPQGGSGVRCAAETWCRYQAPLPPPQGLLGLEEPLLHHCPGKTHRLFKGSKTKPGDLQRALVPASLCSR